MWDNFYQYETFAVAWCNTKKPPLSTVLSLSSCTFGNGKRDAFIILQQYCLLFSEFLPQAFMKSAVHVFLYSGWLLLCFCFFTMKLFLCSVSGCTNYMVYLVSWKCFNVNIGQNEVCRWRGKGVCQPPYMFLWLTHSTNENTPWLRPDVGCPDAEGWGGKKQIHKGSQEPTQCVNRCCRCILISPHNLSHEAFLFKAREGRNSLEVLLTLLKMLFRHEDE